MRNILPTAVAMMLGLIGAGLLVAGVYVLCGSGWAFITGGIAVSSLSGVLFRGVMRG